MSLKSFHLVFILLVIVGADIFGAWGVGQFRQTGDPVILALSIFTVLGGLGLIWYVYRLVRKFESAHIE